MNISEYNRKKITILNSFLIIMVLYIHSYYDEAESYPIALSVQRFFSGSGICGVANNMFFALSGFLFFNNIKSIRGCYSKIKKRIRSLFIPYLIWNIVFVLWYVLLTAIPSLGRYVNNNVLSNFTSVTEALVYLFVKPANYPLWFLRDLMCYVALSPLIYLLLKHCKLYLFYILFVLSLIIRIPAVPFILGASIAIVGDLNKLNKYLTIRSTICCLLVYVGYSVFISLQPIEYEAPRWVGNFMMILGVVSVWGGYDLLVCKIPMITSPVVMNYVGYSFFIYLFHIPVFNIIKKLTLIILGESEVSFIFLFMVNPIIMSMCALFIAKQLQKHIPRVYTILVGGR